MLHPADPSVVFVSPQRHRISWKIGNIALEKAHTLVSPQGVCSKAIFNAAGPNIANYFQAPQPGEITITPGYRLACSHVIHTCCPNWNGGTGEAALRSIVKKSLVKVDELGGSSVAFPVIGTGRLAFPPHEASRIMLNEAVAFCSNNPLSLVKDIRFLLFHGDQGVIDAFKQESNPLHAKPDRKTVDVVQGDLTQELTDAIVNIIGTNMNMYGAGQLGKAIAKASGVQVENECKNLGEQPAGSAVMTSGGNLAAPNIIHMVVGLKNKQHLQLCIEKCLQLAEAKGLKTISLPAAGTGAGGLSEMDSAQATFLALRKILGNCVNLRQVRIVLNQAKLMKPFLDEHKLMQQQENKRLVSRSSPVKTAESPRKKPRMAQYGVPNPKNKGKVSVSGASKAAAERPMVEDDAFTTEIVEHQKVGQLSKKQIDDLQKSAQTQDVKFIIYQTNNRIYAIGKRSRVSEMVGRIWCMLNESKSVNCTQKGL
ncbi:positive regulation of interleukin-4-mediated signaling pathway [Desmophyllum pertusum]|uniref:Positive regulation of interleukin-4-mediated signaling pathway n=1 Tax=Desmophyllum pertusum TaxID=174260 RepID=A0A9W9Z961_9CNID|nr:positive regulation of interleukin-4-mediated signaling pathway [Desmophyllum pertusum]